MVLVAAVFVSALASNGGTSPNEDTGRASITFAVNVHDIMNVDKSADTVLRLIDLFERSGVRGDFYVTAPIVALYAAERPEVIDRLRASEMTISYHVRPPHPLIAGFDAPLRRLSGEALRQALRDYETYRLDMETGLLDRSRPGGYTYVRDVFGRAPVVASVPSALHRNESLEVFAALGARMTVIYHESGTKIDEPFELAGDLVIRPSDWSVTRWAAGGSTKEQFWWAMLDTPLAAYYDPARYLVDRLSEWDAARPPIVTALIHEDNFTCEGATPWALVYYEDAQKGVPRQPPYLLDADDPSRPRSEESAEAVWTAYEELVRTAATGLDVVTSADLVVRAALEGAGP
jgi:hypothetical protein